MSGHEPGPSEDSAGRPERATVDFNQPYISFTDDGIAKVGVRTRLESHDQLQQRYVNLKKFNQKLKQKNNTEAVQAGLYDIDYEQVEADGNTPAFLDMWLYCTEDDVLRYGQGYVAKFENKSTKRAKIIGVSAVVAAGTVLLTTHFAGGQTAETNNATASHQGTHASSLTNHHSTTPSPQPIQPSESSQPAVTSGPTPTATPPASPGPTPTQQPGNEKTAKVTVASINSLGASHTDNKNGKDYGKMPRAAKRAAMEAGFIAKHDFGVVGLQEFQPPQRRVLLHKIGNRYAIYPTNANYQHHFSVNSIIWQKDKFHLVAAGHTMLHYFGGKMQPMPWVRLETNNGVVFEVHNTHDPADTKHHHRQAIWRQKDAHIHRTEAKKLVASGLPGFMLGDYNSRLDEIRHQDRYLIGNKIGRLPLRIITAGNLVEDAIRGANIDHELITPKHVDVIESHIKHLPKGTTDHPAVWTLSKLH